MKKLIALAALAACLPTFAGTVESSNTVGYVKVNLSAGYNMIGVPFKEVSDQDASKTITNIGILDAQFAGYNSAYKFSTQMEVWTGTGYDFYGWAGTSGTDVDGDASLDYTWTDMDAEAVDGVIPVGEGFWIKAEKAGTITLLGEVVSQDVTVDIAAGYNIVANPYPVDVRVTNFGKMDNTFEGYNSAYKFTTTMEVWTGTGYDFYGWAGTSGTDVDGDASLDYTWTDMDAEETDAVIPAGTSVWIKAPHSGTITFTAPAL